MRVAMCATALLATLWMGGCTGNAALKSDPVTEVSKNLSQERVAESWAVQFAAVDSFAEFQSKGWVDFVQKRNYRSSVSALDGAAVGRAHAEAASLFRQAALVSTNAAIQTYAETPQETDPVGAAHLLSVAYALGGDLEKAREASARLDGVTDVTSDWHAPWKTWLAGEAAWPPDLSALPLELGDPTPGTWPVIEELPHYRLPVQADGDLSQPMGDPGALVALALWHEAAANIAAGDPAVVSEFSVRYKFPIEPAVASVELPMTFVYGSDLLMPADGAFLADLMGKQGADAVEAHKDTSLTAYLATLARRDGKISAEAGVDVATALRESIIEQCAEKTNKEVLRHHRMFADIAHTGLLRNLAMIAELEGPPHDRNREEGGKLRIAAMDRSADHTGGAVALMSLAAWDAGNRYPSRAQEIIHRNSKFYPSLEAARFGLDVLALRVGRERVETPGM